MSNDREEWIRRAQAAHMRRRVGTAVLTVLALGAVIFAGVWISRMPSVRDALRAEPVAVAVEEYEEEAELGPAEAPARPRPRAAVPGAGRSEPSGAALPETGRPDPGVSSAAERRAAPRPEEDRVPFAGPVVELGVSMPEPGSSRPVRLVNRDEVSLLLREQYPAHLRHGGYGGTVVVSVLVDESGAPRNLRVVRPSAIPELNAAALRVADGMRFTPEQRLGRLVAVRVEVPLAFSP